MMATPFPSFSTGLKNLELDLGAAESRLSSAGMADAKPLDEAGFLATVTAASRAAARAWSRVAGVSRALRAEEAADRPSNIVEVGMPRRSAMTAAVFSRRRLTQRAGGMESKEIAAKREEACCGFYVDWA